MKIILDINANEYNEIIKEAKGKIVIWGSGDCAKSFFNEYGNVERYDYVVDSDSNKWNTFLESKQIYEPKKILNDNDKDMIVIVATMYFKSVRAKLEEMEYKGTVFSAFHIQQANMLGKGAYEGLERNIDKLKAILSDEKSIVLVDKILDKRKKSDIDYSELNEPNQYFVEEIIKRNPEAVFVDGGGYHGETVDEFIEFQKNKFKKIYSFELDEENYNNMDKKKYDERVEFLNYGMWSEEKICRYGSDTTSSSIENEGDKLAKCIPIDMICDKDRVTFIKMDIEGAEIEALKGACKTITENRPQLAICIYHKPNDIYEIPFLLKKWVPEYKFFIRHHSEVNVETVLYATI